MTTCRSAGRAIREGSRVQPEKPLGWKNKIQRNAASSVVTEYRRTDDDRVANLHQFRQVQMSELSDVKLKQVLEDLR